MAADAVTHAQKQTQAFFQQASLAPFSVQTNISRRLPLSQKGSQPNRCSALQTQPGCSSTALAHQGTMQAGWRVRRFRGNSPKLVIGPQRADIPTAAIFTEPWAVKNFKSTSSMVSSSSKSTVSTGSPSLTTAFPSALTPPTR